MLTPAEDDNVQWCDQYVMKSFDMNNQDLVQVIHQQNNTASVCKCSLLLMMILNVDYGKEDDFEKCQIYICFTFCL